MLHSKVGRTVCKMNSHMAFQYFKCYQCWLKGQQSGKMQSHTKQWGTYKWWNTTVNSDQHMQFMIFIIMYGDTDLLLCLRIACMHHTDYIGVIQHLARESIHMTRVMGLLDVVFWPFLVDIGIFSNITLLESILLILYRADQKQSQQGFRYSISCVQSLHLRVAPFPSALICGKSPQSLRLKSSVNRVCNILCLMD